MVSSTFQAFLSPFRGLKLIISNKKLFALSIAPILADLLLLAILVVVLFFYLDNFVYALIGFPESTMMWIVAIFLFVFFGALAVVLCVLLFVILGSILLSPFLEAISVHTEKMLANALAGDESSGISQILKDVLRSIKNALKLILFIIAIYLTLFPLNLIPVIGSVVYAAISAFVSLVLLVWEFLDFTWDRWRWTFEEKKSFVKKNLVSVAALGFSISILLIIPVLNLALMPAAACGATIWAVKQKQNETKRSA